MDDYSVESLSESKNEWCARLINTLTPAVTNEFKLIFKDALNVCIENNEEDKYLMTFQVYLSGIPKWNKTMVDTSAKRAVEFTRCSYLEDLITCIHVIQLKALSCVRVCQKQKKVDINIPSIDVFLHRVYSNVARKVYMNIYLYEKDISPLQIQKNNRELEHIIKECILNTIRETMPIESILRSYMDETEEQTVIVREEMATPAANINSPAIESKKPELTREETASVQTFKTAEVIVPTPTPTPAAAAVTDVVDKINNDNLSDKIIPANGKNVGFSDTDYTMDVNGNESTHDAPKTIERLEQLSIAKQIVKDNEMDDSDWDNKITIGNDINIDFDIIDESDEPVRNTNLLEGIEILEL
jgi:hypothetical protein